MKRRQWLAAGCAQCASLWAGSTWAQSTGQGNWLAPPPFVRPDLASDEGGLWGMMDREETRLRRSPFMMRDAGLRDYLQGIACKNCGRFAKSNMASRLATAQLIVVHRR